MNRHRQLMFLLGVACLTTADVPSSTKENSDTKILLTSREVSRSESPPSAEPSSRPMSLERDELVVSQSQSMTRSELTTRATEPSTTRCEFTNESETTTATNRHENSTRVPCSDEDVINESTVSGSTTFSVAAIADGLRAQVMRLTNALSKAVAAQHIAQQRERKLFVLEREKYSYLKAASEKVLGVVDNVQHSENGLVADTNREREIQQRQARDHQEQGRSRRKLQVIRRLIAGAEVGLVHIESSKALNRCSVDSRKAQSADRYRNHLLDD